jgi:hypothetical protein
MSRYRFWGARAARRRAPAGARARLASAVTGPYEVKSVDQLAKKYGFAQPDEVAGPANGAAYLDYGRPLVISDSARTGRERAEDEMRANKLYEGIGSH